MCEFFMPNIYEGWEQGHPTGIIEHAKRLGFNHFFSIKRIDGYEFVSLDNGSFIDKQWGNLVFISDSVYEKTKTIIINYIHGKEKLYLTTFLAKTAELQRVCDERLLEIDRLKRLNEKLFPAVIKLRKIKNFIKRRISAGN